jgi:hypothetical protein
LAINFYWYDNNSCGTVCIKVDTTDEENMTDKPYFDMKIDNAFLEKINNLDKTKIPTKDELHKLYKQFLIKTPAIMTGKWLALWTS